jgi:hypothetical protein
VLFRILADAVVLLHLLWILFLIFGAFWGVRCVIVKIFHISGLAFALIIQTFDWYCPLTHLELWLRAKGNPLETYKGSFIIHYMERIVYMKLPHGLVVLLTLLLSGFNVWFYLRRKKVGPVGAAKK